GRRYWHIGRRIVPGDGERTIGFGCVEAVVRSQRNDLGRGFSAELDSLGFRRAIGDGGEGGVQRGIQAGLLVGVEGQQDAVCGGGGPCVLGSASVGGQRQLVGGIAVLDGIDRLEHGDV